MTSQDFDPRKPGDYDRPGVPGVPGQAGSLAAPGSPASAGRSPALPTVPSVPSPAMPKGGGAVRGLGETYAVSGATGTLTVTIPIACPHARGAEPSLALQYESGAGNGPYGQGWDLPLGSVVRRTDNMLPQYHDDDVVLISGEDLVPALEPDGGAWVQGAREADGYAVRCFRPRVEADYDRIERWTRRSDGDQHWLVRTKEGRTHVYGASPSARIADPSDPRRVYRWLRERTYDDRGNLTVYLYRSEDLVNVVPSVWEQHRAPVNTLIDRIRYGVRQPYDPAQEAPRDAASFLFEVVFDYGERESTGAGAEPRYFPPSTWTARADPFSTFKPGFDVRCYRLCRRILVFAHIDELGSDPALIRETRLHYLDDSSLTKLAGVTSAGWRDGTEIAYPEVGLDYTAALVDPTVHELDAASAENLPPPVDGSRARWVDLDGEGIPGALVEDRPAWYYKRNLGGGRLAAAECLPLRPSQDLAGGGQLVDLAGSGVKSLVHFSGPTPGHYTRTEDFSWSSYAHFASLPNVAFDDPNLRLVDLDGDGLADLLVTEGELLRWYPSLGAAGFGPPVLVAKGHDENRGPALVFADAEQAIHLADMTGDGLTDLVRIRNGQVCYWPNLGHGRFGAKVTMGRSPRLGPAADLRPGDIRLADIDGSGTTDLLYRDGDQVRYWLNQAGNFFSGEASVAGLPADSLTKLEVTDLLGDGTSCLVWSSPLLADVRRPIRYVSLTGGVKPHLLRSMDNGLGHAVTIDFAPSTVFYLRDRAAGRPWATRIPFPVHVVAQLTSTDQVGGGSLVARYDYHHGFFDGVEREFRGFGMVEQIDTQSLAELQSQGLFPAGVDYVPPARTRTWFHTGAFLESGQLTDRFRKEWFGLDPDQVRLADGPLPAGLDTGEWREALRAMRGKPLRVEIYADDEPATPLTPFPYRVEEHTYTVRRLQPRGPRRHAVFACDPFETLTYLYERDAADPRVEHEVVLRTGTYGGIEQSAYIGYPRRPATEGTLITYTEHDYAARDIEAVIYRVNAVTQTRRYEVTGLTPAVARVLDAGQLAGLPALAGTGDDLPFDATPAHGHLQRRLVARTQLRYYGDDDATVLPVGAIGTRGLPAQSQVAAVPQTMPPAVFPAAVDAAMLASAGYLARDGLWWSPSDTVVYAAASFFQPTQFTDPFGNVTTAAFDPHGLLPAAVTNALGQTISLTIDYHALAPSRITDVNGNATLARYDALGRLQDVARTGKGGEGDSLASPTINYEYTLADWRDHRTPNHSYTRRRLVHGRPGFQEAYLYADGFGRELMTKVKADAGPAITVMDGAVSSVDTADRWVATGRTGYDNKGNEIRKYEPFYAVGPGYEADPLLAYFGVAAVLHHDPLGRLVRTDLPDGAFSTVAISAWEQSDADENDTVDDEGRLWAVRPGQSAADQRAVAAARLHRRTPSRRACDALGRGVVTYADNTTQDPLVDTPDASHVRYQTRRVLDIDGRPVQIMDDRGINAGAPYPTLTQIYDMLGSPVRVTSADAGTSAAFRDVQGQLVFTRDARGIELRRHYDALRRPVQTDVTDTTLGTTWTAERTVYGDDPLLAPVDPAANILGRRYRHFDQAGILTFERYDFKGNPLAESRQLVTTLAGPPDWTSPYLAAFVTLHEYDALDRVTKTVLPRLSHAAGTDNICVRTYLPQGPPGPITQTTQYGSGPVGVLSSVEYDAKGRKLRETCGNGVVRSYTYDPLTFRLVGITAVRNGTQMLQDLTFTYDAVGNVTEIADVAQPTVFNRSQQINPRLTYTYDSIYRLVAASGREIHSPSQPDNAELPFGAWPLDANDLVNYRESYTYDSVGNLLSLIHRANNNTQTWTRRYGYETSSNRLAGTSLPGAPDPSVLGASYAYDASGDIVSMPHLTSIGYDEMGRLSQAQRLDGGTVHNCYNASGERIRKVVARRAPGGTEMVVSERIYIGEYELYRRLNGTGAAVLEVESVHVTGAQGRVAIIETDILALQPAAATRYQLDNHLGSAVLELDDHAALRSYEEYHPFGATAFHAAATIAEVSLKRYRFLGRERDEETGFHYCSARHYCGWLGRWISPDPKGTSGGLNLYVYAANSPLVARDPGGRDPNDPPTTTPRPTLPDVPHYQLTRPAILGPDPSGDAGGTSSGVTGFIDRPSVTNLPAQNRGGRGGSTMNMEYLSNGNTAGGATENIAGEMILGAGLNIPGNGGATSAGTVLMSGRFGLFPGSEGGILVGSGLYSAGPPGTQAPPRLTIFNSGGYWV